MKADAVFEGGGVRAIAMVGAVEAMEEEGIKWQRLAGTSAGAVIAALLASGYKSWEMKEQMAELDYTQLQGRSLLNRVPFIGNWIQLLIHLGIYKNDFLEFWLDTLLAAKGIVTFADLPEGRLKIIASDISNGRMLILPDDLQKYNMEAGDLKVSTAVTMSATIPFFFRPVIWKTKNQKKAYILDGWLLSNFPVWIFDVPNPRFPTFGFRFVKEEVNVQSVIPTPLHLFKNIFRTMLQAHDLRYISEEIKDRTILIPTGDITATDFDLTDKEIDYLLHSGYSSSRSFLDTWDFAVHKAGRSHTFK